MMILGVESSCDETAAAVVADGRKIYSSVVASQVETHHIYGGVVPELASRMHLEAIVPVVEKALAEAETTAKQIDAVAATRGPGLVGALLVGFSFAKAYAYALKKPWAGINHLEAHLYSVFLDNPAPPRFPFVALLASGGHTNLYRVSGHLQAELLGQTRDDAAGEAYDKVAKLLGLGYPGGAVIDRLAVKGDPSAIQFPRPYLDKNGFDFSFSGLKTAVARQVGENPDPSPRQIADIAAGFQAAMVDVLTHKLLHAAKTCHCREIALVGGVAANRGLNARLTKSARRDGLGLHIPPLSLCGDNAAMIAGLGYHYCRTGQYGALDSDVYSRTRFYASKINCICYVSSLDTAP